MNSFLQKIQSNFEKSRDNYDNISKSRYWKKSINNKIKLFNIKNLEKFRSNNLSKNIDDFYINQKGVYKIYDELEKDCGKSFINKMLSSKNIGKAKKSSN